jgi:hypothetical protein
MMLDRSPHRLALPHTAAESCGRPTPVAADMLIGMTALWISNALSTSELRAE